MQRVYQFCQGVGIFEIPMLVVLEHHLLSHQETHGFEPVRPTNVRGIVEDWNRGREVPVDRRDVVRLVGVRVEVEAQISQGERVYAMSNPEEHNQ